MPFNVFGNSSHDNKTDTSLFVQKPYLRTNYIEANFEKNIDLKNQYRIKILPDPISIREAASKNYIDNLFNDPSILKNTPHIGLNDRNITNGRFIQFNQLPQIDSHLAAKLYVENATDESSLVRINQDNDFNIHNLTNINGITLNTQAVKDNQVITRAYVDQFHQENERSRRDLVIVFYDESSDLVKNNQVNDSIDNKLTSIDSFIVNREPTSDNEVTNKKYVIDTIEEGTILRFNQTLENYLKVSVGNNTYNLTKYDKIQFTGTTIIKFGNTGAKFLQNWYIKCIDKNNNGNIPTFIKSTKTNSPTSHSRATSLAPIGDSFLYLETSSINHGNIIFVSLERTDIAQITNITFYYNSFSILSIDSLKAMGRFRVHKLLEDNTWST